MLKKQYTKPRNIWKVTFELPKDELPADLNIERVDLAGEFNDWDPATLPILCRRRTSRRLLASQKGQTSR